MSVLERIWELLELIFGGLLSSIERGITAIFGSSNARQIARLRERAERIGGFASKYEAMSDEELRGQTDHFR